MSNIYFERYAYPNRSIKEPIKSSTFVSVVIPIYKEENVLPTLKSLAACEKTQHPLK